MGSVVDYEKYKHRKFCDVCWGSDGKLGMVLQTCKTCGVHVHNECYGIEGNIVSQKNEQFQCWACIAVGTTVKVRERDPQTHKRLECTVTERPTACILCSIDDKDWMHAMHPVYDDYGVRGRQLTVDKQLAWAHTVCAFTICASKRTKGCVYGCTQDGAYSGDEEEDDNDNDYDDDDSINSMLNDELVDPTDKSIHHFVYVLPDRKTGNGNEWTKAIRECQTELKCFMCGKHDKDHRGTYRIPLQCCANDEDELAEFKNVHTQMRPDELCTAAAHVGCAFWGTNDDREYQPYRRVFFHPGLTDHNDFGSETVVNMFCTRHAKDLQDAKCKGALVSSLKYPRHKIASESELPPTSTVSGPATIRRLRNNNDEESKSKRQQLKNDQRVRTIEKDLINSILHFNEDCIVNMDHDYMVRVRARYSHWKKQMLSDDATYKSLFLKCWIHALKEKKIKEPYPTIDELFKARGNDKTNNNNDVDARRRAHPQLTMQRNASTGKITSVKKKKASSPIEKTKESLPLDNLISITRKERNRMSSEVSTTKLIDSSSANDDPILENRSMVDDDTDNCNNNDFIIMNTSINSHSSNPDKSCDNETLLEEIILPLQKRKRTSSNNEHQQVEDDDMYVPVNSSQQLTGEDVYMDGTTAMQWDSNDTNICVDDVSAVDSNKFESLCQEIVRDILSKSALMYRTSTTTTSTTSTTMTAMKEASNAKKNIALDRTLESDPIETILNDAKIFWRIELEKRKHWNDAHSDQELAATTPAAISIPTKEPTEYEMLWENVMERVCTKLNYSCTKAIDWSFLLAGNNHNSSTNINNFLDEWDTYEEIPLGSPDELESSKKTDFFSS